jgi:hypothetical protein
LQLVGKVMGSVPTHHVTACCCCVCCVLQLLSEVMGSISNTSSVRLVNASVRGRDAAKLAAALLQCGSLRTLQLHQVGSCLRYVVPVNANFNSTSTGEHCRVLCLLCDVVDACDNA